MIKSFVKIDPVFSYLSHFWSIIDFDVKIMKLIQDFEDI